MGLIKPSNGLFSWEDTSPKFPVIIINESHLRRILKEYVSYYTNDRTHLSLDKDCPIHRAVEPPEDGPIREIPILGGLHHRYTRKAG